MIRRLFVVAAALAAISLAQPAWSQTAGSHDGGHLMISPPELKCEETIVQIHGVGPWGFIYVNPADDPRKQ